MKRLSVVVLLLLAAGASVLAAWRWCSSPPGGGREVVFVVEMGWGASTAARALKDSGLVRSSLYLLYRARSLGVSRDFQAGTYLFDSSMPPDSILMAMARGDVIPEPTHWVTVPEGLRLSETLAVLSACLDIPLDSLEDAAADDSLVAALGIPWMEGHLFPETYEFADTLKASEVLARMVCTGLERRDPSWEACFESLGLTGASAVILASIVEREAKLDSERPAIAGVFLNRLAAGMRLESCATVQYALGEVRERLSYADIRTESPYNTYLHAGLPPGPICSPGLASLEAVAHPDTAAGYLFFVSREDGSGSHLFARTLAGHHANIREATQGRD